MSTTIHTLNRILFATAILLATTAGALAAPITGAYDTRTGDGSKTTPAGNTVGPWVLTSTDSTASWLRRYVNETPTFADLTNLNVVFVSPVLNAQVNSDGPVSQAVLNAGGGGGAPRLSLALDSDANTIADQFIDIHLGTSPSYVDSPTALTLLSGMNLIGNNDAGRYDLTNAGGGVFTDYNAALALVGSSQLLRMTVFLDSFGGADKTLVLDSINGAFSNAIPEPTSIVMLGLAAGSLFVVRRRRRRA
jgi:hypothetical protein